MMKQIGLTICFLLGMLQFVVAQNKADELFNKANELAEAGEFKLANNQLKEAAALYKEDNDMSGYYKALAEQGRNTLDMGDRSKALKYLQSLDKDAATVFKKPNIAQSFIQKYIGYVYYYDGDVVAAHKPFQKALEIRAEVNPNDEDLFRDNYNLGVISRNIGHYSEAIDYYKNAIKLLGENPDEKFLYKIYLQIATVHKIQEDYGAAEDYIKRVELIADKLYGKESLEMAVVLMEKANIELDYSMSRESFQISIKTLKKALEIYLIDPKKNDIELAICFQGLGYAYSNFRDGTDKKYMKESLNYFKKAHEITSNKYANSFDHLLSIKGLLAVNISLGKTEVANNHLSDLKELLIALDIPQKSQDWATFYINAAELAKAENAPIEDVSGFFNKGLKSLIRTESNLDLNKLSIEPYLNIDDLVSVSLVTDILAKKANTYLEYSKKKDVKLLQYAVNHYDEYEKVIDFLRKEYTSGGSKLVWSDFVVEDFGKGIEICLALAKEKKDKSYLEKAYYLSEKSKGLLLLESFQSSKANKLAGLPESTLEEEERLRLDVSDAKQQLFQLKQGGQLDTDAYKAKNEEWLGKKQVYADFVKRIEKEHPDYYKMKYEVNILDLAATQEMLLDDQDLVEYYVTDDHIYAFKIGKSSFEVKELKAPDDLLRDVRGFRGSIYNYYLNAGERTEKGYERYSNQYAEIGYKMYQTLIEPLGELKKRLIIIPAGALANMPFEPILMEKPETPKNYKSHKYLTKKHIVAYNYSATLLSEMRNRDYGNNRETLLAIAPEFGTDAASFVRGKRFALAPLTFNTVEVENVRKMLGKGTLLMGQDAVEPKFKAMGGNYKIIHFATHGMANDRDPDFSLLAFTDIPDSVENEFLYVNDLYNMELNTDLIVLSACETGLGEMRKGEGVISLARGFAYAGTKSIFTTLWSVNDQATANIIEGFYSYLKAGKPKDEALHLAKLDFLEGGNNMTSHPFLWAPYIFIGDSAPMDLGGGFPWLYLGIGGLALVLLLGGFFMMKKGKSNKDETA